MLLHRGALSLLLGVVLLVSGPILLGLTPRLHPVDSASAWVMPSPTRPDDSPSSIFYGMQISGIEARERLALTGGDLPFVFQRFSFSVTSIDEDLVPWFSQSWRGWIRQKSYPSGRDGRVQVTRLERPSGTGGAVTALSFQVGPYQAASFNRAKLLQIPAKLQGFSTLDVVAVSMECGRECDVKAEEAARLLDQILDANAQRASSRW